MARPKNPDRPVCAACGLRVERHAGAWSHLPTVAGREADAHHEATVS